MIEVTQVSLENEMDIVLAQKQMMQVAGMFSLSLSTTTTISASVAEVSRVVIDKTDTGILVIGMQKYDGKYFLTGTISFSSAIGIQPDEEGLMYARKLVPEFKFEKNDDISTISVAIGIPRSFKISPAIIRAVSDNLKNSKPGSPYEELKLKNSLLNQQALEKEEELRQSRFLDEKKNEFISIASHELKTPLTSIKAFSKLALDAGIKESSTKVIRYLEKINTQAGKLQLLIQQLLDVSKIGSCKLDYTLRPTAWNMFMKEIISIVEQMVPSHQISWRPCAQDVTLQIDALRMEQVFTNLITNAAKYSTVGTSIQINCIADKDNLHVAIIDEGIGISEDNLKKIFQKYFREEAVAEKYSGFGMGLYISADIIQEHGGRIWAERNNGRGSTFNFTLPIILDTSADASS